MKTLSLRSNLIALTIPFTLFGALILLIMHYLPGEKNGMLDLAVSLDLLITVPLIYFLLVRKTSLPNTTIIPVMITGLIIGTYFLPTESQKYLNAFKTWALPVIEISVLIIVAGKVYQAIRKFKSKGITQDFYTTLKAACQELLPQKLVLPFATEVAVIYYGFISWRTRKLKSNEFTYHQESGMPAIMGAFIFVILIEAIALHLLLTRWNPVVAWVLTGLSIYTAIQVLGFAKSIGRRPIVVDNQQVIIRYGILNEVDIPVSNIQTIECSTNPLEKDPMTKTLSPFGDMEGHNVMIRLNEELMLIGLYGFRKKFKTLALHVDNPQRFVSSVTDEMEAYPRFQRG